MKAVWPSLEAVYDMPSGYIDGCTCNLEVVSATGEIWSSQI